MNLLGIKPEINLIKRVGLLTIAIAFYYFYYNK